MGNRVGPQPVPFMKELVVVFAVGNTSRGDDAIGPELLCRLAAWLDKEWLTECFELIEDFQLNIEHALGLSGLRRLSLVAVQIMQVGNACNW